VVRHTEYSYSSTLATNWAPVVLLSPVRVAGDALLLWLNLLHRADGEDAAS
jgi:hypothetical protein